MFYKIGKKNAIELSTYDNVYYMYTDTEKEKDEWYVFLFICYA